MEDLLNALADFRLFSGIPYESLDAVLSAVKFQIKNYSKNTDIFSVNDRIHHIGLILSGKIQIYRDDFMGNRSILAEFGETDIFAEAFVCSRTKNISVNIVAKENTKILFFDYNNLIISDIDRSIIIRIIENMTYILAKKNVFLNEKNLFLTKRTTREKILAFLSSEALKNKKNSFFIPFNRQEMADYLSVERSALSYQLGKLKKEKIIDFNKNYFSIIPTSD
ncbi:MAG: Crp/Fnr family transcriptional regulator [Fusobacteriaceae bacterium]|nr:Crp/Fnr family transcriptional regulator [Fusobacteriaceae bacterium]